jgi:hypothetical protein
MFRQFSLITLWIVVYPAAQAYVAKEGNVSAVLSSFLFKTNFEDTNSHTHSPNLGGMALTAIGDINDHGSLELGVFYMNKIYFREGGGRYLAEKTQLIHITMGYRRWWTPSWATSLTFFSAYPTGDIEVVHNDSLPWQNLETSAHDKTEYGFDFATQVELWTQGRYSLEVDARYSYALTNREGETSDHYGAMIGLRYFIQEKQIREGPRP